MAHAFGQLPFLALLLVFPGAVPPVQAHGALVFPFSLKEVRPPEIPGLGRVVKNRKAALVLGKALFWDMNVGSDGMACASCHFHAGADNRVKNVLNPGGKRTLTDARGPPCILPWGRASSPPPAARRAGRTTP